MAPRATNVKNNVLTVTGRERLNVNGAVEFRPTATSKYFARTFFAHWDEVQLRNRFDESLGNNLTSIISPSSATVASNRVQVSLRDEITEKRLLSGAVGGTNIAGRWTLDYTVQRNDNLVDERGVAAPHMLADQRRSLARCATSRGGCSG